jgi:hypothetical protein
MTCHLAHRLRVEGGDGPIAVAHSQSLVRSVHAESGDGELASQHNPENNIEFKVNLRRFFISHIVYHSSFKKGGGGVMHALTCLEIQ